MKRIGMLVAIEIESVMKLYNDKLEKLESKAYMVYKYKFSEYELYILKSGAGQIAAAAGCQYLIDKYNVEIIVNFGIVGGLTSDMSLHKTCIIEKIVHYDFDTSAIDNCEVGRYVNYPELYLYTSKNLLKKTHNLLPNLKIVTCASGDKFVANSSLKKYLNSEFKADIVEMEAAAIQLICDKNNVSTLMIKTVSDSIEGGASEYISEAVESANKCILVLDKIIKEI